jgi:CTP synthase (UTP-ammonia lyase)
LGIAAAEHEESAPDAPTLVISRLSCSLAATTQTIHLMSDSLAQRMYGQPTAAEVFSCNYGLNPVYQEPFQQSELCIAGCDPAGDVRIVELPTHPFFLATLFLPQMRSSAERPHPLVIGLLKAAFLQRAAAT